MRLALEIRPLSQRDTCDGFTAGPRHSKLDEFLHRYAKKHQKKRYSSTFVAVYEGEIVGFVTILPGGLCSSELDGVSISVPKPTVPVLVLARMATRCDLQGTGVGEQLFRQVVVPEALALMERYGCIGIYVDAKHSPDQPQSAVRFYQKFGFVLTASRERESGVRAAENVQATPEQSQAFESVGMFLPISNLVSARKHAAGSETR